MPELSKQYELLLKKINNLEFASSRRLRSARASAQSDQSLQCPHEETFTLTISKKTECTSLGILQSIHLLST